VLAKLFDSLYQKVFTGQTGGEVNRYLALNNPPQVLIMGNSRARYQVDPDSFVLPTYSLCHAGMGQIFQTGLLHVLKDENKVPSVLMLHVDLEEYVGDDNLEDIGNLRYYYKKDNYITKNIDDISRFEKLKYIFKFYRYNGRVISTLKNFVQSRKLAAQTNGYQSLDPIPNDSTTFVEKPTVGNSSMLRFHYKNLRHLQDFVNECHLNKIKLICFTSPYFSARSFAVVSAPPIDSLLQAHNVPYFNAAIHTLPVLKHHAKFWQDADHLNKLGAGYLSKQLATWSEPYLVADSVKLSKP
jgi:hypothetical protein